jgi:hypothetical protein
MLQLNDLHTKEKYMDELKLLIDMVANLPSMALWVLVGFWAYKVIVIGSIYGVIRFCVSKFVEWRTSPVEVSFKGISTNEETLMGIFAELRRLAGGSYFYSTDEKKLHQAINMYLESIKKENAK